MRNKGIREWTLVLAVLAAVMFVGLPAFAATIDGRFVGTYKGQYLGEKDYGTILITIDVGGAISGSGVSTKQELPLSYAGLCNPDGTFTFKTSDNAMTFTGSIDWMNRISGKWVRADNSASGSFGAVFQKPETGMPVVSGVPAPTADPKFSVGSFVGTYKGQFTGERDYGTILLTIDAGGVISGNGMSTKQELPLTYSGRCNPDGTLTFRTSDNAMTFTGSVDWMNRISGKWARADNSARGSFGAVIQKP